MVRSGLLLATACGAIASPAIAQPSNVDINRVLSEMGAEAIRTIDFDICFPATGEEYEALGKNAILMLKSRSAISTELPLRSVYAMHKGVRIPLQRITLLDPAEDPSSSHLEQVSFYLLPIQLMKADAQVLADFKGDRKGFGFLNFSAKDGLDKNAPAFARLDEYDTPGDAEMSTIAQVLVREYPDYFHQ